MKILRQTLLAIALTGFPFTSALAAEPPEFQWEEKEIDRIEIGYGLQLTDVDGDGRTDIVLADNDSNLRAKFVAELSEKFDIEDKGELEWVLGVKVNRKRK